jgi:hypothetical protein
VRYSLNFNSFKLNLLISFSKEFCFLCKKDISCLKRHIRKFHQLKYECDHCECSFLFKNELRTHMKSHEKCRNKNYECLPCKKEFKTRARYNTHIKIYHLKKDLIFCEFCFKVSLRFSILVF